MSHRVFTVATVALLCAVAVHSQPRQIDDFFRDFTAEWVSGHPSLATRSRYFTGAEQDRLERRVTPESDAYRLARIALARKGANATVLIGRDGPAIVATAMVGHDGHRGWVYYVATVPGHRGNSLGRAIMYAAEDWLRQAGIEKLQLMVRPDNTKVQAFYQSIGYGEQQRIIYAKWLDGRELTP